MTILKHQLADVGLTLVPRLAALSGAKASATSRETQAISAR
jgi:hypothetical protein